MEDSIRKADILVEAIPYIQAFRGRVIVAKYGGSAIDNPVAMRGILQDVIFLSTVGIRAVLVHGGGPAITRLLEQGGHASQFVDGIRVTTRHTVRLVNRALAQVNDRLVKEIGRLGGQGVGLVPDSGVVVAAPHKRAAELGAVGGVRIVQAAPIRRAFLRHAVPVISPVGIGADGQLYNINADDVASRVAIHMRAEKLVLLTNVRGILRRAGDSASLISTVSINAAQRLVERRVIQSGMIPKVEACIGALHGRVKKTHIIDASIPHALLLEIFTKQGIGTEIVR